MRERFAERSGERVQRTMVREHPMQMRVFDKSVYPVHSGHRVAEKCICMGLVSLLLSLPSP